MTSPLRRSVLALCWIAVVGGAILFLAGAYTGYVEGVEADEAGTAGRVMPAEFFSFVLGPVIAVAGAVVAILVPRASKVSVATR
ncbi:hypothetical protein [Oerskovia jenensis]|uniref:hypothetical protein n=1 Tax=Oerskovia jenensis TaxID=162169 RepID=UPI0036DCD4A8